MNDLMRRTILGEKSGRKLRDFAGRKIIPTFALA
jgi:hypothetical protein